MPATLRVRLTERIARWARKRQGEDLLPVVLRARRLYILPTRAGYGAAVLLFVMLVAGLNYTNSLALLLTFLLAGFVLVGMHECQRTLLGLELISVHAPDCSAGEEGLLELRFANHAGSARRALAVRSAHSAPMPFELGPGEQLTVRARHRCDRRGRHRISRLELSSTAPFGLFRSWTWLYLPVEVLVYPRALGTRPLPPPLAGRAAVNQPEVIRGDEEWTSLRAYQAGDSPRGIAWKIVARGGPYIVGQYTGSAGSDYRLELAALDSLNLEAALSQLRVWVDSCTRLGANCSVELAGSQLPAGRGPQHRTTLLRALALYGEPPP